jgi:hypothetical protein
MPLSGREAWLILLKRASFFVRFEWPFLRPGLLAEGRRAQGLSRRPEGPAKRLGLDSPEHGAMLAAALGMHSQAPVSLDDGTPNGGVPEPYFALANVHGICRDDGLGQAALFARRCLD